MHEYSPKRRTALVLTGSGSSGAYHAGALRALDESGIKIDLIVGSGVGVLAAAFGGVAGGAKLYGPDGFWHGLRWSSLYRVRPLLRLALALLLTAFLVFLLPLAAALVAGLLFPLLMIADLLAPGLPAQLLGGLASTPAALRAPYLAALAAPVFALSVLLVFSVARAAMKKGKRFAESLETVLDAERARARLLRRLWDVARGVALSGAPPDPKELSHKYVALAVENLGQPGFREVILCTGDLETGGALPFVLLSDEHRARFAAARARGSHSKLDGLPAAVDLRSSEHAGLLFDAAMTGLLPPLVTPPWRVAFPRGSLFAGETHRLTDATLAGVTGLAEAIDAGAEQIILVSATPEHASVPPRRRGVRALADAALAALERRALERDLETAGRFNRMVQTVGHQAEDGSRAWQDPESGRVLRSFSVYVVRPTTRALGPLELNGATDPATEVEQTLADMVEQGYRDAYRLFVEPVVGAVPEPRSEPVGLEARPQVVGL
jgi:hypothetical protein